MNKKRIRAFLLSLLLGLYLLVGAFFAYILIQVPRTYAQMEKDKIITVQQELSDILDNTPKTQLGKRLETFVNEQHIDIVLYDNKKDLLFSTFPGVTVEDTNNFISTDPVLYKTQGKVETKQGMYTLLYWIYHTKTSEYLERQYTILNISVILAFILLCISVALMTKWLLDPLTALRVGLKKMRNYQFTKIDGANDAVTMEFNAFSDALQNRMQTVSNKYTELEMLLLFEKERLAFFMQITRALIHELKTPLHQTILENAYLAESKDVAEVVAYNIDRTEQIMNKVNSLLGTFSANINYLETTEEDFDVITLFTKISEDLFFFYQENNIGFYPDIPQTLPVRMNRFVVQIILHNLLLNAAQYAKKGTEVVFSIDTAKNKLILQCENIASDEELARLNAGEQILNIVENHRSGNGLHIMKELTRSLGGEYDITIVEQTITITIALNFQKAGGR